MYQPAQEIAPGFTAEDYEDADEEVMVWPECMAAYRIFTAIGTQWAYATTGMSSIHTGLRYADVYPLIDRATKTDEEWDDLFQDIRIMESAALKEMRSHIKTNKPP